VIPSSTYPKGHHQCGWRFFGFLFGGFGLAVAEAVGRAVALADAVALAVVVALAVAEVVAGAVAVSVGVAVGTSVGGVPVGGVPPSVGGVPPPVSVASGFMVTVRLAV
jgi:hypothetical protein